MRALTLTQPWAGLVASGIKLVENRPRRMIKVEDFGRPFAIHASREIDASVYERIRELAPELVPYGQTKAPWARLSRITSAVIAVATIERAIDLSTLQLEQGLVDFEIDGALPADQRRWFFGPIGYVLRDVRALAEPVACRGHQGFWTLPADVEAKVRAQIELEQDLERDGFAMLDRVAEIRKLREQRQAGEHERIARAARDAEGAAKS